MRERETGGIETWSDAIRPLDIVINHSHCSNQLTFTNISTTLW